ncbi:MAG TPA: septation protein IspZ [Sphingomonadales bacterium]|nr:septation protein IspZ [Sphingomonadales bacterium]
MKPVHPPLRPVQRLLIDFGPLIVFFVINFAFGIYAATGSLMAVMPLALFLSWRLRGAVSPILWVSGALVLVFGGLTLYLADERFIKLKPTILFSAFGLTLVGGWLKGKPLVKYLLDPAFPPVADKAWLILTRNWGFFFLLKAAVNEMVWRNFSTDAWVSVKTFGYPLITFLFVMAHYPLLMKHVEKRKKG